MLCKDIDILKLEPGLFMGAYFPFASQTLSRGVDGSLSGTTLTVTGQNFTSQSVSAGHVVYLSDGVGNIDGVFEIVSVDSATQLTLSVVRSEETQTPISIGISSGLFYRVSTLAPQLVQAEYEISQTLRLKPGCPDSRYGLDNLTDQKTLKSACTYWSLALIFGSMYGMYSIGESPTDCWDAYQNKLTNYMQRAENSLQHLTLSFTGI